MPNSLGFSVATSTIVTIIIIAVLVRMFGGRVPVLRNIQAR